MTSWGQDTLAALPLVKASPDSHRRVSVISPGSQTKAAEMASRAGRVQRAKERPHSQRATPAVSTPGWGHATEL